MEIDEQKIRVVFRISPLAAVPPFEGVSPICNIGGGVYWHPIWNILEEGHQILLANPQHLKAVPGRKTDVKDSEWLADLHRHGLLKPSFVPPKPVRVLRELTRYRKTLVQERAQEVNRLQKGLEGANIKLAAVATEVLGTSGREMIEALVNGLQDANALAELARGRLRAKLPDLRWHGKAEYNRITAFSSNASWPTVRFWRNPSLRSNRR